MKIYRVGGAVRDKLLNYPSDENDWVVVGATPQKMIDLGYVPVGSDFPVFINPRPARNTHWLAPSENPATAIRDLPSMPTRISAWKRI